MRMCICVCVCVRVRMRVRVSAFHAITCVCFFSQLYICWRSSMPVWCAHNVTALQKSKINFLVDLEEERETCLTAWVEVATSTVDFRSRKLSEMSRQMLSKTSPQNSSGPKAKIHPKINSLFADLPPI